MELKLNHIYEGDCLETLKTIPDKSVDMCVTSPPYYALRDYGTGKWIGGDPNCPHYRTSKRSEHTATGHKRMGELGEAVGDAIYKSVCPLCGAVREDKQIGLEETPESYISKLADVFDEVKRVLKDDGTLWVNIGDSYWGGGWRNASFNEHSGDIQKGSKGTHCGESMPNLKGNVDSYKNKDLIGIPWMLAFELRKRGWYLRQDIIWHKPNPMPESVTDRCTKSHEYIFLLSKSPKYYFDYEAIQEEATGYDGRKDTMMKGSQKYNTSVVPNQPVHSMATNGHERWKFKNLQDKGQTTHSMHERRAEGLPDNVYPVRNKRSVWSVNLKPFREAHFATYTEELIAPCILAGSKEGGVVLDCFMGSGTTAIVCKKLSRKYIGCELNPEYIKIAEKRIYNLGESLFDL